jgi:hypothetical protein
MSLLLGMPIRLRRLVISVALIGLSSGAAACGSNPNSPDSVSYAGTWNGAYGLTTCTSTGDFQTAGLCPVNGGSAPFGLVLIQSSRTVSGTFTLGTIAFTANAADVANDGSLILSGSTDISGLHIVVTWNLTAKSGVMNGTINQVWTSPSLSGQMTIVGPLFPTASGKIGG